MAIKCPDCGEVLVLIQNPRDGNDIFFKCKNNHKHEAMKTGNNEIGLKKPYPFNLNK